VAVGNAWTFPLNNQFQNDGTFLVQGREPGGPPPKATFIGVSPAYFDVLAVPVLRGRSFDERDRPDGQPVVVVNQRLARHQWADVDPVGGQISIDNGTSWRTVVGVVGDIRQAGLDQEPSDAVYVPIAEYPGISSSIFVRVVG